MANNTERWLPVVGYEDCYEVSDRGRVRSIARVLLRSDGRSYPVTERLLSTKPTKQGYLRVTLVRLGRYRWVRVHTLVLEAFDGPCPDEQEALHGDGDGTNDGVLNLRWGTSSENSWDTVRHGNHHYRSRTTCGRGHLYSGANLRERTDGAGGRRCRSCEHAKSYPAEDRQRVSDEYYVKIMAAA